MIDLHCAKNCLNCSNFSLMLNAGKEGSTGKLLTADKGEIKPFMPTKNFCPQFTMLIKKKTSSLFRHFQYQGISKFEKLQF